VLADQVDASGRERRQAFGHGVLSSGMVGDIFQPTHLLLILVVVLLVLGPKRLPEAGRSLGRGIHDFRGALNGGTPTEQQTKTPAGAGSARAESDR
jgi:sec-independent protein translocase protein TatA